MFELMKYLNVIAGLLLMHTGLRYWRLVRDKSWAWLKLLYAIAGAGWAIIYTLVIIETLFPGSTLPDMFASKFIRPMILLTLCFMAVSTHYGLKRRQRKDENTKIAESELRHGLAKRDEN